MAYKLPRSPTPCGPRARRDVGPARGRPRSSAATNMEDPAMGLLGATEFNNLNDLFVQQLEDLYDAEKRLTEALPKMAEAAHSPELKSAFQLHHRQTQTHVAR